MAKLFFPWIGLIIQPFMVQTIFRWSTVHSFCFCQKTTPLLPTPNQTQTKRLISVLYQLMELPWGGFNQLLFWLWIECVSIRQKKKKSCYKKCGCVDISCCCSGQISCEKVVCLFSFLIEMFWFFFPNICVCFILLNLKEVSWFLILFVLLLGQRASGEVG